jgi:transcription initiation factor TFIIIB Brf1 subunit/transcription initiation factor TFIIB
MDIEISPRHEAHQVYTEEMDFNLSCIECRGALMNGVCTTCGLVNETINIVDDQQMVEAKLIAPSRLTASIKRIMKKKPHAETRQKEAASLCTVLELPAFARKDVDQMIKAMVEKRLMVGRRASDFELAAIAVAARNAGIPVSIKEISEMVPDTKPNDVLKAASQAGLKIRQINMAALVTKLFNGETTKIMDQLKKIDKWCNGLTPRMRIAVAAAMAGLKNSHENCGVSRSGVRTTLKRIRMLWNGSNDCD